MGLHYLTTVIIYSPSCPSKPIKSQCFCLYNGSQWGLMLFGLHWFLLLPLTFSRVLFCFGPPLNFSKVQWFFGPYLLLVGSNAVWTPFTFSRVQCFSVFFFWTPLTFIGVQSCVGTQWLSVGSKVVLGPIATELVDKKSICICYCI